MPANRRITAAMSVALAALPTLGVAEQYTRTEKFVFVNCGRCHVIGKINQMGGIGSTPSFAAIRTLPDWEDRVRSFYALNPHPAFTQIEGVTEPFPENRPSPIHPLMLSPRQIDVIVEFVRGIKPKDLGAAVGVR